MTKDQLAQYKKGYRAYNANREIEKQREAESYSKMVQEQIPQPEPLRSTPDQPQRRWCAPEKQKSCSCSR